MRTEQQQNSAANGADAANTPNGGVDQKWRKNYVPYQESTLRTEERERVNAENA